MKCLFNVKCVMFNVILLYTLHFTHYTTFAQPISSAELINNAKDYDGKNITYTGEVIGDVMARGEYAWINVNDGKAAIGIWLKKDLTQDILYTGSYKFQGDWIMVSGVFNRACAQHGGDLDIHAQTLKQTQPGEQIQERLSTGKWRAVLALLGMLCIILILRQLKRK